MADIRINSLSTTAPSSASDDFIAVDGATNGTRKLNGYSPSFGGNATVGGTLTVNGAATFNATATISSAGIADAYLKINNTFGKEVRLYSGIIGTNNNGFSVRNETNTTDWLTIDGSGNAKIPATTASSSTSTGALVVSGGVGVAGAVNIGGGLVAGQLASVNSIRGGDAGVGTSIIQFKDGLGNTKINFKGDGAVTVSNTTASTSTSTGALVVSGGVGVAGAAYIAGAIAIGNTVNTVSPTSPNRTITMVIGGTTYYIHAKTTND